MRRKMMSRFKAMLPFLLSWKSVGLTFIQACKAIQEQWEAEKVKYRDRLLFALQV
jgi:hypothetical protein